MSIIVERTGQNGEVPIFVIRVSGQIYGAYVQANGRVLATMQKELSLSPIGIGFFSERDATYYGPDADIVAYETATALRQKRNQAL